MDNTKNHCNFFIFQHYVEANRLTYGKSQLGLQIFTENRNLARSAKAFPVYLALRNLTYQISASLIIGMISKDVFIA